MDATTNAGDDLYLVRVTADEALVARLALRGAAPHMTPGERIVAMRLEDRFAHARPLGGE